MTKPTGHIKERYSPTPTAAEKRHHLRLIEMPCCGCGKEPCGIVHHVLGHDNIKRWRRDHRIVVPVCPDCHADIHKGESAWEAANDNNLGDTARQLELESVMEGIL